MFDPPQRKIETVTRGGRIQVIVTESPFDYSDENVDAAARAYLNGTFSVTSWTRQGGKDDFRRRVEARVDELLDATPASPSVSVPTPTPTAANGKHETWAERVVAAAAGAMGSDVAVDLGEHRDVATAVLRELATQLDETLFKHVDSIAPALRILADEIERTP
jgi:hypothetical protein